MWDRVQENGAGIDFAPRFGVRERTCRAPQIVPRGEPIAGAPRVSIKVRPTRNRGRKIEEISVGSRHVGDIGGRDAAP